jgi:hypothetical protein
MAPSHLGALRVALGIVGPFLLVAALALGGLASFRIW